MDRYAQLEISSRKLATSLHCKLWMHQYSLENQRSSDNGSTKTSPFCDGRIVTIHSLTIAKCTCIGAILGLDKQPTTNSDLPKFRVLVLTTSPPQEGNEETAILDHHTKQIKKLIQITKNPYNLVSSTLR